MISIRVRHGAVNVATTVNDSCDIALYVSGGLEIRLRDDTKRDAILNIRACSRGHVHRTDVICRSALLKRSTNLLYMSEHAPGAVGRFQPRTERLTTLFSREWCAHRAVRMDIKISHINDFQNILRHPRSKTMGVCVQMESDLHPGRAGRPQIYPLPQLLATHQV